MHANSVVPNPMLDVVGHSPLFQVANDPLCICYQDLYDLCSVPTAGRPRVTMRLTACSARRPWAMETHGKLQVGREEEWNRAQQASLKPGTIGIKNNAAAIDKG